MTDTPTDDRVLAALRRVASDRQGREVKVKGAIFKLAEGTPEVRLYALALAEVNKDGGPALTQIQLRGAMIQLKEREVIAPGDVSGTFWVRMG